MPGVLKSRATPARYRARRPPREVGLGWPSPDACLSASAPAASAFPTERSVPSPSEETDGAHQGHHVVSESRVHSAAKPGLSHCALARFRPPSHCREKSIPCSLTRCMPCRWSTPQSAPEMLNRRRWERAPRRHPAMQKPRIDTAANFAGRLRPGGLFVAPTTDQRGASSPTSEPRAN